MGFFDFRLSPPSSAREGGSGGLTLSFCTARTQDSCGVLGVRRGFDLGARCTDPEAIRAMYRRSEAEGVGMFPVRYADRDGWLTAPTALGEPASERTLILCDGEQYWYVRSIATGAGGLSAARFAFDLFLKTVRLEPAAAAVARGG